MTTKDPYPDGAKTPLANLREALGQYEANTIDSLIVAHLDAREAKLRSAATPSEGEQERKATAPASEFYPTRPSLADMPERLPAGTLYSIAATLPGYPGKLGAGRQGKFEHEATRGPVYDNGRVVSYEYGDGWARVNSQWICWDTVPRESKSPAPVVEAGELPDVLPDGTRSLRGTDIGGWRRYPLKRNEWFCPEGGRNVLADEIDRSSLPSARTDERAAFPTLEEVQGQCVRMGLPPAYEAIARSIMHAGIEWERRRSAKAEGPTPVCLCSHSKSSHPPGGACAEPVGGKPCGCMNYRPHGEEPPKPAEVPDAGGESDEERSK